METLRPEADQETGQGYSLSVSLAQTGRQEAKEGWPSFRHFVIPQVFFIIIICQALGEDTATRKTCKAPALSVPTLDEGGNP